MIQIALAYSPACEVELQKLGFEQRVVYVKPAPSDFSNPNSAKLGDREFFGMSQPPFQFVTTSYWGAGAD